MNTFICLPWFPRKPYPIPDRNGQNLYPFSDQKSAKTIPLWAAHTSIACKRETPPGRKEHRRFVAKISISPIVRVSKTVLSGFDARDSGFRNICQWNLDTVYYNRLWDSPFLKLYFGFQLQSQEQWIARQK